MRITDWSSDVCSSDLETLVLLHDAGLIDIDLQLPVGNFDLDPIFGAPPPHLSVSERVKCGPLQMAIVDHFATCFPLLSIVRPAIGYMHLAIGELAALDDLWVTIHNQRDRRFSGLEDRKRVVWGKGGSVRVDFGG